MIVGLRERGNTVAVTGNSTGDGPILSKADVGFASGMGGTEVAKQTSDIIMLNNSFGSILTAIKWGRRNYETIKKVLVFQLTIILVAAIVCFFSLVISGTSALSIVQLIWVSSF